MSVGQSVGALLEDYVARGVFRAAALPADTAGKSARERYRLVWFRNRQMDLEVDARTGRVALSDVLPAIAPRSRLDRQLRAWLRARQAPDLPAHRRLDPARFKAALRNSDSGVQLGIRCAQADTTPAVRKLLHLVNELYLDFLAGPEHYDWIVETFELDPDHPHWP